MTDAGKMPRRILHTSDFHLESLNDRGCHSLETVIDIAIKADVNLCIIAGDFFEHNRVNDNLIGFVLKQLRRLPVDVVILPGNHDCLVPESVYHRVELWEGATNVRVFKAAQGEIFTFPGLSVWGKPIASYSGALRPLAGVSQHQGEKQLWHIAVAHGFYVDTESPLFFSSHPVAWEEIVSSHQDYIAFGHVAVFRCVCDEPVKAYYSGAPQVCGTVNIVDFDENTGVQVTRHPL